MGDPRETVESFLDEQPDSRQDELREVLSTDRDSETWDFDDIPLDSGDFGELVSSGLVERRDGEYTLADPDAVQAVLDGEKREEVSDSSFNFPNVRTTLSDVDRIAVIGLAGALVLVGLFRLFPYPAVFRDGAVVLSSNDPYYYRYLVQELLRQSSNPFNLEVPSSLNLGVSKGEPLFVVTLWWVTALLGEKSLGGVLAWYPVVSAIVTGILVYAITVRVTDDKRAGLAAVALLAVVPAHAMRTGLGFADHHAFDYPWLALTALATVSIIGRDIRDVLTLCWVVVLGVGLSAQTLAWEAGPLLLIPLGLFVVVLVHRCIQAGQSPVQTAGGLVPGVALATLLTTAAHAVFGWHTAVVTSAPALLLAGTISMLGFSKFARRFDLSTPVTIGIEAVVALVAVIILPRILTPVAAAFDRGVEFLLFTEGIAETRSLFSSQTGSLFSPALLFGFVLFLALPYMAWLTWQSSRDRSFGLLAVGIYAWYFFALGILQVRFAGQLAIFAAIFAGFGFVHLASRLDLVTPPTLGGTQSSSAEELNLQQRTDQSERAELEWPTRRDAMYTAGLGLGIGAFGMLQTPIKHSQLTLDADVYEASMFMRQYSEERGWEYPENYVLSEWGRNRAYNWFVNGQSKDYGFALENYDEFVSSTDSRQWYERLNDSVGFVVIDGDNAVEQAERLTIQHQLSDENLGINTGHYRAVWTSQQSAKRVYTLVPGATITGPASPGTTMTVEGSVDIGNRTREVAVDMEANKHGVYREKIPLPGSYDVGETRIDIASSDVTGGQVHSTFDGEGYAYWSFDEGSGVWAYDRVGGRHGRIHGGNWTDDGVSGTALSFEPGDPTYVDAPIESLQEFTIGLWAYPEALDETELNDWREIVRTTNGGILIFEENGRISFRLPGAGGGRVTAGEVETGTWTHVAVSFDGTTRSIYVDGTERATDTVSVDGLDWGGRIRLGDRFSTPSAHGYVGILDEVRIYDRALSTEELKSAMTQS